MPWLAGQQPDLEQISATGYLMRTTAVYGNGKFGIADRHTFAHRPHMGAPFQAEMLTVWLIRAFTLDLVEHCAQALNPNAARLSPQVRRALGVGNSTGLGMAPFWSIILSCCPTGWRHGKRPWPGPWQKTPPLPCLAGKGQGPSKAMACGR